MLSIMSALYVMMCDCAKLGHFPQHRGAEQRLSESPRTAHQGAGESPALGWRSKGTGGAWRGRPWQREWRDKQSASKGPGCREEL